MLDEPEEPEPSAVESAVHSVWKDGMVLPAREDGGPPETPDGFTMTRLESGDFVIRKKRQRNMQKIGVGGFYVKARGPKILNMKDEEERQEAAAAAQAAAASALAAATAAAEGGGPAPLTPGTPVTPTEDGQTAAAATDAAFAVPGDKPKKKAVRRNKKYKLIEAYPLYLQESFFGKDLIDNSRDAKVSESEEEKEEPPPEEDVDEDAQPEDVFTLQLSKVGAGTGIYSENSVSDHMFGFLLQC